MKGDLVPARWAKRARRTIEDAINELNALFPRMAASNSARIVWGKAERDELDETHPVPAKYLCQQGLIGFLGDDFEVAIWHSVQKECPDRCHLSQALDEPVVLPRSSKELYNVFSACEAGVTLDLHPDLGRPEILVWGVTTVLAVEAITGRILNFALEEMSKSHFLVRKWLIDGIGDDRWSADGCR